MNSNYRKRKLVHFDRNNTFAKLRCEDKRFDVINRVKSQEGICGQLILFQSSLESASTVLHNAVDRINANINIKKLCQNLDPNTNTFEWTLTINNEIIASEWYSCESAAKKGLSELSLEYLKKKCFTISRKIHPRDSRKVELTSSKSQKKTEPISTVQGKAAQMMLKMGWTGGGLGANEQGCTDIIQPFFQIDKQGFGTKNIAQEIRTVLQSYVNSRDINSIAFSPEFSTEERAIIHSVARKLNLKSKSYGNGFDRLLVVTSKVKPWDLVYSLLEEGGETEELQLIVPTDYE